MRPRRILAVAALALLTAAGTAAATHTVQPVPEPGPDDLGLGTNDVREEPSHPDDDNGFPGDASPYFSPAELSLVLDALVAPGTGYSHRANVDVDNVVNRALHGDNYDDQERTLYPGVNRYGAWWGWWADTGSGGELQEDATASKLPGVGEANGAIDDAPDCDDRAWDEWIHRGPHPCPETVPKPAYPDDQMFAFVQPGTHDIQLNSVNPLGTYADEGTQPDFEYRSYHERWEEEARPTDVEYDASLLVTTEVVSAVNPREVASGEEITEYDPFMPAEGLADPDRDHAVDVDVYTALHPEIERAYRIAVWDPGDEEESPGDALHPAGPKGWAKHELTSILDDAEDDADAAVASALAPSERQRGIADDLVQGPFFQEPNTPDDVYGIEADGTDGGWATHDPTTTYGGLDGDYFEPGPDQAHGGYEDGERFWVDAKVTVNAWPGPPGIAFGAPTQLTPEAPSPSDPVGSLAQEGDDNTQGPGVLSFDAFPGTWYDADGDGWVGEAGADGHPYDNGTTDDPQDTSSDEFRPSCGVEMSTTLYPTTDTDGDGTEDWGAAGVYLMSPYTLAFASPWMDVLGHDADPFLEPARENVPLGSYLFPQRERLESYRRTGPIHLDDWACSGSSGWAHGAFSVVLPTGTLDFGFEAVTEVELTDPSRVSEHGDNKGQELAGQRVVDVDRYDPVVEPGP